MKNIIKYLVVIVLFCACEKEKTVILDLGATKEEISRIELRADHKTLLPNGVAKMEFTSLVYGKKFVDSYNKNDDGEYLSEKVEVEYLIPSDVLPKDYVKVYDSRGNEVIDNVYSTTSDAPGSVIEFVAKAGDVESNKLTVTIRSLPDESYDELVIPVIFHFLLPPVSSGPSYDVSVEYLENVLQRMNDVFNRRVTTDPNGGNVKITFKLALFDKSGVRLQEAGKHVVELSKSDMSLIEEYAGENKNKMDIGYNKFIIRYWSTFLWDPNKYLNIWVARRSGGDDYYALSSYLCEFPTVIQSDYASMPIPGLEDLTVKDTYGLKDVEDCLEVGIILNYTSFLNPSDNYSLAKIVGRYYGLYYTDQDDNDDWVDGDNDYCADTYYYYYKYNSNIMKNNRLYGEDADADYEWFTSFNVMDNYSRKNSVSVDQAQRMRMVLERCPSRWMYKSNWAFTGEE